MATYEEIYGKRVKDFDSDPTLESSYEGQVWYDKSTGVLKSVVSAAAWSSTSNMVNALARSQGAGTTSAGLSMGGQDGSDTKLTVTEEYNGTGWSLGGSMPAAKSDHAGAGTQTAAFAAGGSPYLNSAYNYNGTSWSGIPNIGTARQKFAGCGTTTASLVFGAQVPGSPPQGGQTEEYNGSSWSEQNDLNTARAKLAGCGTQTAGLGFGGYQPTIPSQPKQKAQTEQYDGTSWSEVADLITAVQAMGGAGTQTAALCFGGYNGTANITTTQDWDGTAWTTSPATLGTGVSNNAGAGTSTSALSIGGYAPSATSNVEEYNVSINTITAAAWAAGGSISTVRTNVGSTSEGSQTAAMVWGGRTGPPPSGPFTSNKSDTYDGSSFSAAPNLNTAARTRAGGGTTTAAWCAGGTQPTYINATEEFNGSSWTSVTNVPIVLFASATGVQTAGLVVGVNSASPPSGSDSFPGSSLEYDGTNWATGGSPSADRTNSGCSGTQTAGTLISGQPVPYGTRVTTIEEYDGSSWTSGGNDVVAVNEIQAAARGPQTATLITGGNVNPPAAGITTCRTYDGTTAATTASMGTGRRGHGSDGGQTSGLVMTGQSAGPPANNNPNYTANAEEFTAATTAVTSATLTTS